MYQLVTTFVNDPDDKNRSDSWERALEAQVEWKKAGKKGLCQATHVIKQLVFKKEGK